MPNEVSRSTIFRDNIKQNQTNIKECYVTIGKYGIKLVKIETYRQVGDFLSICGYNENGSKENFWIHKQYVTVVKSK